MNDVTRPSWRKLALTLRNVVSLSGSTKCQPHVPLELEGHVPVAKPGFVAPTWEECSVAAVPVTWAPLGSVPNRTMTASAANATAPAVSDC